MALSIAAVPTANAQSSDSQATQDMKKKADDQKLTPQRPMRDVTPNRANQTQNQQPAQKPSTTGQGTNESSQPNAASGQTQNQPNNATSQPSNAATSSGTQSRQPQQNAAQPAQQNTAQQPATQQPSTAQQPSTQQNTAQQPNAQPQQNAASANNNGRVALNATQQRQLSTSLRSANITPVTNVNFSLTVGTAVPADVRLVPVTTQIVAVLPQYRGYSFFATRDEIVIVEPTSKQIVALVPVQASAAAAEPSTATTTTKRTEGVSTERRHVVKRAQPRRVIERDVTVGYSEPDTVIIERDRPYHRHHGFWPFFWWD
jgi:hypothetical protein